MSQSPIVDTLTPDSLGDSVVAVSPTAAQAAPSLDSVDDNLVGDATFASEEVSEFEFIEKDVEGSQGISLITISFLI